MGVSGADGSDAAAPPQRRRAAQRQPHRGVSHPAASRRCRRRPRSPRRDCGRSPATACARALGRSSTGHRKPDGRVEGRPDEDGDRQEVQPDQQHDGRAQRPVDRRAVRARPAMVPRSDERGQRPRSRASARRPGMSRSQGVRRGGGDVEQRREAGHRDRTSPPASTATRGSRSSSRQQAAQPRRADEHQRDHDRRRPPATRGRASGDSSPGADDARGPRTART